MIRGLTVAGLALAGTAMAAEPVPVPVQGVVGKLSAPKSESIPHGVVDQREVLEVSPLVAWEQENGQLIIGHGKPRPIQLREPAADSGAPTTERPE